MGLILVEAAGSPVRDQARLEDICRYAMDHGHGVAFVGCAESVAQLAHVRSEPKRTDLKVTYLSPPIDETTLQSLLRSNDHWIGFLPSAAEFRAPSVPEGMGPDRCLLPWGISGSIPPKKRRISDAPIAGWLMSTSLATS